HHILWLPLQPVLAYHNWSLLALLQVLRHQQDTVGEDIGVKIEHDFVAFPLRRVVSKTGARVHRLGLLRQLADDVFPEVVAIPFTRLFPLLWRRCVGLGPELLADEFAGAPEPLRVGDELIELALLARGGVEVWAKIGCSRFAFLFLLYSKRI